MTYIDIWLYHLEHARTWRSSCGIIIKDIVCARRIGIWRVILDNQQS